MKPSRGRHDFTLAINKEHSTRHNAVLPLIRRRMGFHNKIVGSPTLGSVFLKADGFLFYCPMTVRSNDLAVKKVLAIQHLLLASSPVVTTELQHLVHGILLR